MSLIDFLMANYPDLDSFAKLRRVPYVEKWLLSLRTARPPYTDATRDQFILHVRRFFEDIRTWDWPGSPAVKLFRRTDFPKRKYKPRTRKPRRPRPRSEFPVADNVFHQILKRYLDIRGATLRPRSLERYQSHVLSFVRFLQTHFPTIDSFAQLERSHIEAWLQALANAQPPYKNKSRRDLIRTIRRFLEDMHFWDWPGRPILGLIRPDDFPPPQRFLPRPLPPDVDANLMEGLRREGDVVSLGLMLARKTGLRLGELRRLELGCLTENPKGRYSIRVPLGKLRSEREIPVDRETVVLVETIREQRGQRPPVADPETGRPSEFLLCNDHGDLLKSYAFGKKIKQVAKNCGITQNVHAHRLRHTYATELLRNGVSLPGVMRLLGHTTMKMTLRYVEVTNEDLGRDYLKAMEKARLQYTKLKNTGTADSKVEHPDDSIQDAFDHLVTRIQMVRFDHPDSARRKKIQRFVERLRRAQRELPALLR